jgi:hypothetical protein
MHRFLILALVFCTTAAKADGLSAEQINEQLVGQSIAWADMNGWSTGSLFLLPDGKAEITVDDPHPTRDIGEWTLQGDQLCTTWSAMRSNLAKCYTVREMSPGHYVTSGGNEFDIRRIDV